MELKFNEPELKRAINDFYNATGINIVLVDVNHNCLSGIIPPNNFCTCIQQNPEARKKCEKSDIALMEKCKKSRKIEQHICHAGLLDTAVPVIRDNEIIGFIILGQMRNETDFENIYKYVKIFGIDRNILQSEYENLPYCNIKKTESIANIATMLTEYILFKNLLKPKQDILFEKASAYISDNFKTNLTTKEICDRTGTSKNILYKVFKNNANCTVGEYIAKKRIEKAKELLINSKLSLQEISEEVGINNYTYFSKLFKKQTGVSPFNFKKENSH